MKKFIILNSGIRTEIVNTEYIMYIRDAYNDEGNPDGCTVSVQGAMKITFFDKRPKEKILSIIQSEILPESDFTNNVIDDIITELSGAEFDSTNITDEVFQFLEGLKIESDNNQK